MVGDVRWSNDVADGSLGRRRRRTGTTDATDHCSRKGYNTVARHGTDVHVTIVSVRIRAGMEQQRGLVQQEPSPEAREHKRHEHDAQEQFEPWEHSSNK